MENTPGGSNRTSFDWNDWTKKDSEELVLMYLEDYYRTLDDYYLQEALQIAKDDDVDVQKIMRLAKSHLH
ncbi:MAG TPA: hypothetical protein ENK14_09445 [Caldithrix sp.]|nr:hypothetical protein [Caldithrix sp.]